MGCLVIIFVKWLTAKGKIKKIIIALWLRFYLAVLKLGSLWGGSCLKNRHLLKGASLDNVLRLQFIILYLVKQGLSGYA